MLDRIDERLVFVAAGAGSQRQRMTAAGFRETAHQGVGGGFQKQALQIDFASVALCHATQLVWQGVQVIGAAHIHGHRDPRSVVAQFEPHKVVEQLRRKVVHAVIAAVFEGVERHRFARTGHAGDQNQLHVRFQRCSSSRACASETAESCLPSSMRASSRTRSSPPSASSWLTVCLFCRRLLTRQC